MIQRFSSLSVHEKQACFPGCPFFVFFLKSIIAETFPHLYTNGALSFYFLFPIIGQLTDKCNPFFLQIEKFRCQRLCMLQIPAIFVLFCFHKLDILIQRGQLHIQIELFA